ncbi:MAG: hypothetical protein OWS03_06150 [Alicyclobacillaceae bacterium]|nr:hypothetical protein [Alicyclobacillaceae bacterium]
MNLETCPRCGALYAPVRRTLCPKCQREENALFEKARAYLKQEPACTVFQLAAHLDVSTEVIEEWIREGYLLVRNHPHLTIACERCGEPALGRYCEPCRETMEAMLADAAKAVRAEDKEKGTRPGFYSR